jgi:hypothetical protein
VSAFAADPFAVEPPAPLAVDLYTAAYRVSGTIATRFSRVADILNQVSATHLIVDQATISEFDDPSATLGAHLVHVAIDEVLLCVAGTSGTGNPDMQVQKRAVQAQIGIPPFRVTGTIHVPPGTRPVDGLLNAADRFLAMTDVTIACATHPELGRATAAVALRRSRAHIVLVTDDERPDELMADLLDERTAKGWLASREMPDSSS